MTKRITIEDFETHVGPNRGEIPFRWWVAFSVGNEAAHNLSRQLVLNFADFVEWLVAKGEFDGFDESGKDGLVWIYEYPYEEGRATTYTFDEVIKEFSRELETDLEEFLAVTLSVIEDFVLDAAA